MGTDLRDQVNMRFEAALRDRELSDPRDAYRRRLRALRDTKPELFERATRHYQEEVLPTLEAGGDAIETWIDYGRFLAELMAAGRVVAIDDSGSARSYASPLPPRALVLHLPHDRDATTMPLAEPIDPSAAQRAAYDLLVRGRFALDDASG